MNLGTSCQPILFSSLHHHHQEKKRQKKDHLAKEMIKKKKSKLTISHTNINDIEQTNQ